GAPASAAPRLAASMMPGPPPVATTLPRSAVVELGAAAVGNYAPELAGRLIPAPPVAFAYPCRSPDDDRRCHPPFPQIFFRFLIFEMEANTARRIAKEKVLVKNRQPVGGGSQLC